MKEETRLNKLAALLGLEDAPEVKVHREVKESKKALKPNSSEPSKFGPFNGVKEEEIQSYRFLQGLQYFLEAPKLFTYRKCKFVRCQQPFMVSRRFVAYCSFYCMAAQFEEEGIGWKRGNNIEGLVLDPHIYKGNEPLWIGNLDEALEFIQKAIALRDNPLEKPEESATVPVDEWSPFGDTEVLEQPTGGGEAPVEPSDPEPEVWDPFKDM